MTTLSVLIKLIYWRVFEDRVKLPDMKEQRFKTGVIVLTDIITVDHEGAARTVRYFESKANVDGTRGKSYVKILNPFKEKRCKFSTSILNYEENFSSKVFFISSFLIQVSWKTRTSSIYFCNSFPYLLSGKCWHDQPY